MESTVDKDRIKGLEFWPSPFDLGKKFGQVWQFLA